MITISSAINGLSAITLTQYGTAGNTTHVTDPLGRVTDTAYDERNRSVSLQAPFENVMPNFMPTLYARH